MYAGALKRIAGSGENDVRRFLLAECLEAYAPLDESEGKRVRALLQGEAYREVEPLMKTTYERGIETGIERGERLSALRMMEAKFGPLSSEVRRQVEELSRDELERLQIAILTATSLADLGLDG